jgi:thymidylate synthase (FAD)
MSTRAQLIDRLRWKKFSVLSDGFVCLVDVMGDDAAVVQAARVSYGAGTKTPSDDRTLIRHLFRHRHTTPFEMAEVKLLVRVPMDTWRQWIRHRAASVNEYSTRFSKAIDSMDITSPDAWRLQSTANRQGSGDFIPVAEGVQLSMSESRFHEHAEELYQTRLEAGVAREQARKDLPLSTYTEAYWKIDLHNLVHFLGLRMDKHAQKEIRDYATIIGEQIVAPLFPLVWEAYYDYHPHMGGMLLSRQDAEIIREIAEQLGLQIDPDGMDPDAFDTKMPNKREQQELIAKLQRLGIVRGDD